MKLRLLVAALVVVAAVYFVTRPPQTGAPTSNVAGAGIEVGEQRPAQAADEPSGDAVKRDLVGESSVVASAVSAAAVLRVVVEGIPVAEALQVTTTARAVDPRTDEESRVDIRESWPCRGATTEFALDTLMLRVAQLGEAGVEVEEIEVAVDHPERMVARARVALSSGVERTGGQTVYEVHVELVPAAILHGRMIREDRTPAADGYVGAALLEDDFPVEGDGYGARPDADGVFELRVPASGRYGLATFERGRRPTTTRVDAELGERTDVGTVLLDPGHAITGRVLRQGKPLAGATMTARPPRWYAPASKAAIARGMHGSVYEGRTFQGDGWTLHLLWMPAGNFFFGEGERTRIDGSWELGGHEIEVDTAGNFAFVGMGAGEYLLRMRSMPEADDALPGSWDDTGGRDTWYRTNGQRPALRVRAPKHGVEFHLRWGLVRFEFEGELVASDEQGHVYLQAENAHATPVDENGVDLRLVANPFAKGLNFMGKYHATGRPIPGGKSTFVLQVPPGKPMRGEVVFPGRLPVPVKFRAPKSGGEIVVPVRLEEAREHSTLVVGIDNPADELPNTFRVQLWRAGMKEFPPDERQLDLQGGQLRIEGLLPGKYHVQVRAGKDTCEEGLFHMHELELELHPNLVTTRSVKLNKGAGLRLTVRGENGELLRGEFEFFNDRGLPNHLLLYVPAPVVRQMSYSTFYPHDANESANELDAGHYRLRVMSKEHREQSVQIELRDGEYEKVDITLSK